MLIRQTRIRIQKPCQKRLNITVYLVSQWRPGAGEREVQAVDYYVSPARHSDPRHWPLCLGCVTFSPLSRAGVVPQLTSLPLENKAPCDSERGI